MSQVPIEQVPHFDKIAVYREMLGLAAKKRKKRKALALVDETAMFDDEPSSSKPKENWNML